MPPQLSEDEIDDVIYFARTGENADLEETLKTLSEREKVNAAEILITAKDEGKSTALHMASGNGHRETLEKMMGYFTSVAQDQKQGFLDAFNEHDNTGLHWAALGGHLDTVKLLLEHGASPALANEKNYVPLDLAIFNNHEEVAQYFLSFSKDIESRNGREEGFNEAVEALEVGDKMADKDSDEKHREKSPS